MHVGHSSQKRILFFPSICLLFPSGKVRGSIRRTIWYGNHALASLASSFAFFLECHPPTMPSSAGVDMAEPRLCPKCLKMNLHRYTAQTLKNTGGSLEKFHEETYWKCVASGCEYREEEGIKSPADPPPRSSSLAKRLNLGAGDAFRWNYPARCRPRGRSGMERPATCHVRGVPSTARPPSRRVIVSMC